jgi:serine/threonine protein kinase
VRFPEGTVINHRYLLVSPGNKNAGGSGVRAAASAKGAEVSLESAEEPPSSCPQRSYAAGSYVAPLGHGGSSVVFLARQVVFGAHSRPQSVPRAVKFYLLSPTLARHCDPRRQQAANIRNLSNEIENLTSVHHANILKVIDTGFCVRGGQAVNYLVTEYVPGPTLAEVIACGATTGRGARQQSPAGALAYRQIRRSPTLVVRILDQLCGAIEHLHDQGIYHCDIAPKNVFIHPAEGYRPILGDFALGWQPARQRCANHVPLGAMRYAPPLQQQMQSAACAAHWDMYGFAKSALELVNLAPGPPAGSSLPWKDTLTRYLREALVAENGVTAAALHRGISRLL